MGSNHCGWGGGGGGSGWDLAWLGGLYYTHAHYLVRMTASLSGSLKSSWNVLAPRLRPFCRMSLAR